MDWIIEANYRPITNTGLFSPRIGIKKPESISISSPYPVFLCYNVLCDFVSLIRVRNDLWEDILQSGFYGGIQ